MSTELTKVVADFQTQLSTKIDIGGTTATLQSALDDDGNTIPSGSYILTLDTGSNKEYIKCDIADTAITNIQSVSRQGVKTTGASKIHRVGCPVIISDWSSLLALVNLLSGTTDLDSSSPLGYDGDVSDVIVGNQLATVTYVLSVLGGGTVNFDQQVIPSQVLGETVALNDIVYFKEADHKWYKADADLIATFDQLQLGVCKIAGNVNDATTIAISGPVSGFSSLTAGSKYYLSNTAGAISTTPGTYSVFVGWALTTTTFLFNSVLKTLPTQKEKDAMVGSLSTPSSTNKYTTQDNQSSATTDQSQTTQNATVEVGEANATTKKNKINQSFIATKTKIRGVKLYKSANTGTFTGTVTVALYADSGGSPTGSALATVTITNLVYNNTQVGEFEALFASEYSLVVGDLYWIQISTSTSDTSNHPNLGTNSAGGYSNGSVKYWNTTDGYVAISTIDLYFKTLEGVNSQSVKTDTSGKISDTFIDHSAYVPAFQQIIPETPSVVSQLYASMPDGSAFFTSDSGESSHLKRYQRDAKTGMYYLTHEINPTLTTNEYMVVIGNYLYIIGISTNFTVHRFLAADLTGETSCTVPTIAASGTMMAWTDGTNLYLASNAAPTTVNVWSVSGTTFSAVTTQTTDNFYNSSGNNEYQTFYDGKNVYILFVNDGNSAGGDMQLYRMDDIYNQTQTSINLSYNAPFGENNSGEGFLIGIDDDRLYVVVQYQNYNENGGTVKQANNLVLIPFSKTIMN